MRVMGAVVLGGSFALVALSGCPESRSGIDAAVDDDAAVRDAAVANDARERGDAPDHDAAVSIDARRITLDAEATDAWLESPDGGGRSFTTTYVIDDYVIPGAPTGPRMDTAPGFDLDGMVSVEGGAGTCEDAIGDYRSPAGEAGIDNQLVGVLASTLQGFITDFVIEEQVEAGITSGEQIVAIRVSGIDSYTDDASVTVDVFYVTSADCALETCPLPGGVLPDASWVERTMPIAMGRSGSISAGRLTTTVPSFPLVLDASGTTWRLQIRDAIVAARITPTSLAEAAIGGAITVDDVVTFAEEIMPGIGETARGLLTMYADYQPQATDPLTCQSMSAGLGLSAVRGALSSP